MKCPRCSHEVEQGQSTCPDCGYELPDTWWPVNPNLFQGYTSHPRSGSARETYLYLTAIKELVRRCGLWKIVIAVGVLIGLMLLVSVVSS